VLQRKALVIKFFPIDRLTSPAGSGNSQIYNWECLILPACCFHYWLECVAKTLSLRAACDWHLGHGRCSHNSYRSMAEVPDPSKAQAMITLLSASGYILSGPLYSRSQSSQSMGAERRHGEGWALRAIAR
jgi:hypothetical protein